MCVICRYYVIYDIQTHFWVHGNDHTLYIFINYLYLFNAILWKLMKVPRAQTHSTTQCFLDVDDSCYIFLNSKEKHIASLQMCDDDYVFNEM